MCVDVVFAKPARFSAAIRIVTRGARAVAGEDAAVRFAP